MRDANGRNINCKLQVGACGTCTATGIKGCATTNYYSCLEAHNSVSNHHNPYRNSLTSQSLFAHKMAPKAEDVPFEETLSEHQRANLTQGKQYKSTADQAYKEGKFKNGACKTASFLQIGRLIIHFC